MQLALTLLLATASPSTSTTTEPGAAASVESMTLDLSGLEPLDPRMGGELAQEIHARAAAVIAGHGVPSDRIHLTIGWSDVDTFDYEIVLSIDAWAGVPARRERRPTGPDTEHAELVDVVEAALARALTDWDRDQARGAEAGHAPPLAPAVVPSKAAPLGPLGWTGVGVAVVGAAGVGAGIALLVREPTAHPSDETKLRSWRPGGIALTTLGGLALVTGSVLAVVDSRRRASSRRVALAPWGGRRGAGVAVRMHF